MNKGTDMPLPRWLFKWLEKRFNRARKVQAIPASLWALEEYTEHTAFILLDDLRVILEKERKEQIELNGLNAEALHANSILEAVWRVVTGAEEPPE